MTSNDGGLVEQWHGFPRTIPMQLAKRLAGDLQLLLETQRAGARRHGVDGVGDWFDPLARGPRLRGAMDTLPPPPPGTRNRILSSDLGQPFLVSLDGERYLVTPEGAELVELLERAARTTDGVVRLSWEETDAADARLLELYRRLSWQRLTSVVNLRGGSGSPLLPQAVGQVLFLLLNGNVGAERALRTPLGTAAESAVDAAVQAITEKFVRSLSSHSGITRSATQDAYTLSSGYGLTEARRRLGGDLSTSPIFIESGAESRVLARLGSELGRRQDLSPDAIRLAIEEMARAYRDHRPALASYGMAFGTAEVGATLSDALVRAMGAGVNPPRQGDAQ